MDSKDAGVRPLEGITIVELGQVVAGPFATMLLGDFGADVIKIERPGTGDLARTVTPAPEYFDTANRNKRSVTLDLKREAGREAARRLLADADAFLHNAKPGRIETFGLDYETVRELNPSIVYCDVTGFGEGSPYQDVPAWDMLIQAMSGIMSLTGREGEPPTWSGMASGDLAASMYATIAILVGLYARETGAIEGEFVEVPMLDAAITWLTPRAGYTFHHGTARPRSERHTGLAPFGQFECADGRIVVAAGTDPLWRSLCAAIDREDLLEDDRFESVADRLENRPALIEELDGTLEADTRDAWLDRLHAEEVPAAPIYDTLEVWADEHVRRRALRRELPRESGDATVIDNPLRFDRIASAARTAPPDLGADTEAVLRDRGFDDETLRILREEGVI
ncbi:MAG: CaiB/BaiF CoA transferase family protein [Halobacteriota archaeon]